MKYPLPDGIREAWDKLRKEKNRRCELAWADLASGKCKFTPDAAAKHDVTRAQLTKWIALHHLGELVAIQAKRRRTR